MDFSPWSEVTNRVLQGSFFRPLLFVLYLDDIAETIRCELDIYLHDTKIYSKSNSISDVEKLQCDLDSSYAEMVLLLNLHL